MCFFDQQVYQCGDFKWGPFRLHCAKEYRTGETCGMKLVMNNIYVSEKCKICYKLDVKYDRKAKEEERIRLWQVEGVQKRNASIEASRKIIKRLNRDIAKLTQERHDMRNSFDNCATKEYKPAFTLSVYRLKTDMCVPGVIDLATGHRPKDSENKHILEGSLSKTETLLSRETPSLPKSRPESLLAKEKWHRKMAPFDPTIQSANDQSNLCESQKDDIGVPGGDFLLGPHAGIKCNRQETMFPDASNARNICFSFTKPSITGTEFTEDGENCLETTELITVTTGEKVTPHDSNHMREHEKRAHLGHTDKFSAPSAAPSVQENAHHRSKYVHTCKSLALPTLPPSPILAFRSLPTFQDKVLEIPRSFQLPCAERTMLQDLKSDRRPRNGCAKPEIEIEITPREPLRPLRSVLSLVHHDLKSQQSAMIDTIVLLVKQGVFDYLMEEFYVYFNQTWAVHLKSCPGSSDSSSGSDETSVNPPVDSNSSETSTGGNKRTRGGPDKDNPERGGKDDPKRPRLNLEMGSQRFACPYVKRDPSKFGAGTPYYLHGCAGQGWKDLAKLKEHLYRAHHSFFQCPRCKIRLKSQAELNGHSEADEVCESRPRCLEDGFDLEIYLHLHNKRKTCKGQTDAERWKDIFSRLFPDQPVPSPYVVVFETGNIEASTTSELVDMENFEAYRRREMPKSFANRATMEALRLSEPIARQLLGQVPDMIRDSDEDVSRQYQGALSSVDPSPFNMFRHSMLPSHPEMQLSTQSTSLDLNCQTSNSTAANSMDKHNFLGSQQFSSFPSMMQATTSNDLYPGPLVLDFDSGQTKSCFCNDSCSCPNTLPGWISTKDSSSEDISLILHLVQNMSNRIATLEHQNKSRASHPDTLFASSFNQPPSIRRGLSSSIRQDYMGKSAENLDTVLQVQNSSTALPRPFSDHLAGADTSNDSLDWENLLNIEHSGDYSSQ